MDIEAEALTRDEALALIYRIYIEQTEILRRALFPSEEGLKTKRAELHDVLNQLAPLEKKRKAILADINAYERLIAFGTKEVVSTEEQCALRLRDVIGMPPKMPAPAPRCVDISWIMERM